MAILNGVEDTRGVLIVWGEEREAGGKEKQWYRGRERKESN